MENRYIIQWKSKVNGRMGRGGKSFTLQEAEDLAAELNREYPQIEHEVLTVPSESQPAEQPSPGTEVASPAEAVLPAKPIINPGEGQGDGNPGQSTVSPDDHTRSLSA